MHCEQQAGRQFSGKGREQGNNHLHDHPLFLSIREYQGAPHTREKGLSIMLVIHHPHNQAAHCGMQRLQSTGVRGPRVTSAKSCDLSSSGSPSGKVRPMSPNCFGGCED